MQSISACPRRPPYLAQSRQAARRDVDGRDRQVPARFEKAEQLAAGGGAGIENPLPGGRRFQERRDRELRGKVLHRNPAVAESGQRGGGPRVGDHQGPLPTRWPCARFPPHRGGDGSARGRFWWCSRAGKAARGRCWRSSAGRPRRRTRLPAAAAARPGARWPRRGGVFGKLAKHCVDHALGPGLAQALRGRHRLEQGGVRGNAQTLQLIGAPPATGRRGRRPGRAGALQAGGRSVPSARNSGAGNHMSTPG